MGLQTLRSMGSVSVAWYHVLAGYIGQAYKCASGDIACILQNCHNHPGQLRGVFSSVEAVLSACFRLHAPLGSWCDLLSLAKSPPSSSLKLDSSLDVHSSTPCVAHPHARRVVPPRLYPTRRRIAATAQAILWTWKPVQDLSTKR